jgi:hypothetical protein
MPLHVRVKRLAIRTVTDEYLDLYILALAAVAFTILGITGLSGINVLASAILALLAVLAFSQIRSRRQIADIAKGQHSDPLSIFQSEFPGDLEARRGSAASLLLIGMSMTRTVQVGSLTVLRQMLRSGGRIRVLLIDPADEPLVRAASEHRQHGITAGRLRRRIEATLDELVMLREATDGDLQIRVTTFVPQMGISVMDAEDPDGLIVLQHYEHRPAGESAPIFSLRAADGFWYEHFAAEAERLWDDGTPWPLAPAAALARSARPLFMEEFGPEVEHSMSKARELLITGVTRNTLVNSGYGKLQAWLSSGCSIRMLLVDPVGAENPVHVMRPGDTR